MSNKNSDTLLLILIMIAAYIIYKTLFADIKDVYRCGNCKGIIIGKPENCRWCNDKIDW